MGGRDDESTQKIVEMFAELQSAIDRVWTYYLSQPFKSKDIFWDVSDNFMQMGDLEIPRPNHGIAHTLRVTSLIPLIIAFYKQHVDPDCQPMMAIRKNYRSWLS